MRCEPSVRLSHRTLIDRLIKDIQSVNLTMRLSTETMCQLLGMNCNVPTDICFSFTGFRKRGGDTDVHADGWGIAFFEG